MIITVTGQDGSGKTTLVKRLTELFADRKVATLHLPASEFVHDALKVSGDGTPMGDTYTDRLIFALDNRLTHYRLLKLRETNDIVITQRGWMDSFIHGAVQGYAYHETAALTKIDQLVSPTCSIYLNCDPWVAYGRVRDDPDKDKFETLEYMTRQYHETKSFYEVLEHDRVLAEMFSEPRIYIDTTRLSHDQTLLQVVEFLETVSPQLSVTTPTSQNTRRKA